MKTKTTPKLRKIDAGRQSALANEIVRTVCPLPTQGGVYRRLVTAVAKPSETGSLRVWLGLCDVVHIRSTFRRVNRASRSVVLAVSIVTIAACSQMPVKEGPNARLLDGIHKPRDRNYMDIKIHSLPGSAWPKCLEMLSQKNPALALISAVTLSVIHACARVPRDHRLAGGKRPWCTIAVPEGDEEALEHELRHCEGWDHPHDNGPQLVTGGEEEPPFETSEKSWQTQQGFTASGR